MAFLLKKKNELVFNINQIDIENLILQGFTDISEYMKTFEINDDNEIKIEDEITVKEVF